TKLICFIFGDCDPATRPITPDRLMGDANCDGKTNIADVTFLIARIFSGGPPPPSPCFEYERYGSTLKLAVDRSVVFYLETISPGKTALRINTLKRLHAVAITLLAPNGVKLNITKQIIGPDIYWSQTGDTVNIGILDIYAKSFITPADTNLIEITGDFEILSVEATQILPDGETVYLIPTLSATKPTGDLSRITVPSFDAIYPNPSNPETRLAFSLPKAAPVKIEVYNILGRKVATVTDRRFPAGSHSVLWDGRNASGGKVSSGIYFVRFTSGDTVERKKMVILK
ncbi:MAG: T9SS type A sorting domain-containing protein, partial [candidate division Zixibacteria bacterium]|nr:T9SS type A sorting domain-containing protein [candidate division Zixibacteria bacterium]